MHEPAACGDLPAQQAKLHIGPLANEGVGMLAYRIDSSMVAPRIILATRIKLEPKLCLFSFRTIHLEVLAFSHGYLILFDDEYVLLMLGFPKNLYPAQGLSQFLPTPVHDNRMRPMTVKLSNVP